MGPCGICGVASSLRCSNCNTQTYCGKPHQRQHWPQHRLTCRPHANKPKCLIEELRHESMGRYLVAATDITEETILFKDTPLVIGPPSGAPPTCFGCLRSEVTTACTQCGVPICSPRCEHLSSECEAIRKATFPFDAVKHSECILPLRCLLNVRQPTARWKDFLRLEAHLHIRRHLPVWFERNARVVEVLRNYGLAGADGSENELLQKICGILDVNSFEVRNQDGEILRAVFPRAALMAHSCIANVHVAVDDNHVMTVRAARSISKGETLFYCYTSVLQDTAARQEHLWEGKYFRCQCPRCQDPSELGIHVGSIWCPRCITGLVSPGHFDESAMSNVVTKSKTQRQNAFRQFPIEGIEWKWRPCKGKLRSPPKKQKENEASNVSWQCSDCKHLYPAAMIRAVYHVSMDNVDSVSLNDEPSRTVDRLEKVLENLQRTLTPQHAVILHAKQLLGGAYRDQIATTLMKKEKRADSKLVGKSTELCRELATVLDKLECGAINRNVGIALHGLYEPLFLALSNRDARGTEFAKGLSEIRDVLVAALRHLRVEPPQSPEGRLAAAAFAQLSDVRDRLENVQQQKSKHSRRNMNKTKKTALNHNNS